MRKILTAQPPGFNFENSLMNLMWALLLQTSPSVYLSLGQKGRYFCGTMLPAISIPNTTPFITIPFYSNPRGNKRGRSSAAEQL